MLSILRIAVPTRAARVFWILLALCLNAETVFSQAVNATLLGTVTDITDAVVPNATVTIAETRLICSLRVRQRTFKRGGESDRAGRTVEAARNLREELRKQVLGWERGLAIQRSMLRN
jgi:hypothetical protein